MKNILLFSAIFFCLGHVLAVKDTIRSVNTGTWSFDPNGMTINFGDTVVFILTSEHNAREVSEETWTNNETTALPGGFEVPFGGGEIVPSPGLHYFICVAHASMGMKGTLNVNANPVGIGQLLLGNLTAYPNPAKEMLYVNGITVGTNVSYSLVDLLGREFRGSDRPAESPVLSIRVADLPRGIYLLTVLNGNTATKRRILLE